MTYCNDATYFNYNYFISDDHAYTEDHILVMKLFVYKVPRRAKHEDIFDYFSNFGNLVSVRFIADKRRNAGNRGNKVAFVHFDTPEAATRALKVDKHFLYGKRFLVKACDSWHQPDAADYSTAAIDTPNDDMSSAAVNAAANSDEANNNKIIPHESILNLNDYCLVHILERLSLRDQMRCIRVCYRFIDAFKLGIKRLYKQFELYHLDGMTLWEIRDFFNISGDTIVQIKGVLPDKYRERVVELLGTLCPNVKELDLETCEMKAKTVNKLIQGMPKLETVRFHYCTLVDKTMGNLHKLQHLKSLSLSENFGLEGRHLSLLPATVENIALQGSNLNGNYFIMMCKNVTNLKELDIRQCYNLTSNYLRQMVETCTNLESLKMSALDTEYEIIAKLPNLKKLTFYTDAHDDVRQSLFAQLIEHKKEKLEYLHISGTNKIDDAIAEKISQLQALRILVIPSNDELTERGLSYLQNLQNLEEVVLEDCANITNQGLIRLIIACKKLKRLHLQYCKLLSDSLIFDLIAKLRIQARSKCNERKEPVILLVEGTEINEYLLNDPEFISADKLIKVYFKKPPTDALKYDGLLSEHIFSTYGYFDIEGANVIDLYDVGVDDNDDFELYNFNEGDGFDDDDDD